jgi:hypothetical protein
MQMIDASEHDPAGPEKQAEAPQPSRFTSWRGFLAATVAVNLLFVYGMLAGMSDATVSIWYKSLIWLPFNVIATAIYLAIMTRLGNAGWGLFRILCALMIVADWSVMFSV